MSTKAAIPARRDTPKVLTLLALGLLSGCVIPLPNGDIQRSWSSQIERVRSGDVNEIVIDHHLVNDKDFADLSLVADRLVKLSLSNTELSPSSLTHLEKLTRLEHLVLRNTPIDDKGLASIARVNSLKFVNLPHADASNAGLARLAELPNLELLRIGGGKITGSALAAFENHKKLRFLHLIDTPIDDAALESVAKIESLESFYLDGGNTTDDGKSRMIEQRPDLHVHFDQEHFDRDPQRSDHGHSH